MNRRLSLHSGVRVYVTLDSYRMQACCRGKLQQHLEEMNVPGEEERIGSLDVPMCQVEGDVSEQNGTSPCVVALHHEYHDL